MNNSALNSDSVQQELANNAFVRKEKQIFTLIELLVVIAMMAILAALLLPALGNARQRGISTQCTSNLRQCGMVIQQYSTDYDGYWRTQYNTDHPWYYQLIHLRYFQWPYHARRVGYANMPIKSCPGTGVDPSSNYHYHCYGVLSNSSVYFGKYYMENAFALQKLPPSAILMADSCNGLKNGVPIQWTTIKPMAASWTVWFKHNKRANSLAIGGHVLSSDINGFYDILSNHLNKCESTYYNDGAFQMYYYTPDAVRKQYSR